MEAMCLSLLRNTSRETRSAFLGSSKVALYLIAFYGETGESVVKKKTERELSYS